jgi:hsp70-interacting protein
MESLLRWSIEHSTTDGSRPPPQPRKDLDPGIVDFILGKPDSVLMREALEVAVNHDRDEEERVTALDNLEMVPLESPSRHPAGWLIRVDIVRREY